MIQFKFFRKLKFQILLFMTINVVVWFLISDFAIFYIESLEENSYSAFLIFQAILFILINIPFVLFLIKHIDKPVQKILSALNEIKDGNFFKVNEMIQFNSKNEFDEIKKAIISMSAELENAKELQENIESQRIMLFANIAHDLKTPITTIQGYSKALADEIFDSQEKKQEYISSIYSKSKKMNDLIDRMFEYVKLDSKENILHFENTDIAELLRNCIASSYSEFEDRNINIDIQIPDEKIIRNIDKVEIERVFTNLLNNILSHNKNDIKVLVKMNEDSSVIVADSGEKIPENIKNQLFSPFVKGDSSRKSGKGSGLGLSLSQKIMERHSGKITYIDSYPNYTKAFLVEF